MGRGEDGKRRREDERGEREGVYLYWRHRRWKIPPILRANKQRRRGRDETSRPSLSRESMNS